MNPLLPATLLLAFLAQEQDPLPRDLAGWLRRQDAQFDAGAGEAAVAEATARAEKEPQSPEALFLLGRILGNTGKMDGARARFQAALDADPNYSPAWRGMALVHLKTKEYDTASREARRAYELDESQENLVLLVQALYEKGDRPGSNALLKDALAKRPADHDLRYFYAARLLNEGLLRDAEREARQVLAADGEHMPSRQLLVIVLLKTGRGEAAVGECREFIRRSPKDFRPRMLLYEILIERKDYAAAAALLEEVLALEIPAELRDAARRDLGTLKAGMERKAAAEGPAMAPEMDERKILADLESKDVEVRRAAMRILSSVPLNFLPFPLLRRAGDEDETVRSAAVRLIGKYGEVVHLQLLDVLLFRSRQKDPSVAVRARAIHAAAAIGSPASLLLVVRAIDEPEPEILGAVVRGIRTLTGRSLVDDPDAAIPAEGMTAVRERAAKWWFEDPTAKQWRRKAADAVAAARLDDLAWYLVPWVQEEDAGMRAAMLDCFARLSGEPSWRDLPTTTKEEREAARDRAYAFLAAKDKAAKDSLEKK